MSSDDATEFYHQLKDNSVKKLGGHIARMFARESASIVITSEISALAAILGVQLKTFGLNVETSTLG